MAKAKDSNASIRLFFADDQADIDLLKGHLGDDITVETSSVKYKVLFPRDTTPGKIKVTKTGIIDTGGNNILELDSNEEGYYIPLCNRDCVMKGVPTRLSTFDAINSLVRRLVAVDDFNETILYARKAGMRAAAKTKMKELDWASFVTLVKTVYTEDDYKEFLLISSKSPEPMCNGHTSFRDFWEECKSDYPMWAAKTPDNTTGRQFLKNLSRYMLDALEPTYNSEQDKLFDKYKKETDQFKNDYPLLEAVRGSHYQLTQEVKADILLFSKWKADQTKINSGG